MVKYLISAVTTLVLLGGMVSPASADEGSGFRDFLRRFRSEQRSERNKNPDRFGEQNILEIREQNREARDRLASRSQELRVKLKQKQDEERAARLLKFWDKAADRLRHVIGLERRLAERIRERLEKSGRDTTEALRLLGVAEDAIVRADKALDGADAELRALVENKEPIADVIGRTRELHAAVIRSIRAAHRALVEAIVVMRGPAVGNPTP